SSPYTRIRYACSLHDSAEWCGGRHRLNWRATRGTEQDPNPVPTYSDGGLGNSCRAVTVRSILSTSTANTGSRGGVQVLTAPIDTGPSLTQDVTHDGHTATHGHRARNARRAGRPA